MTDRKISGDRVHGMRLVLAAVNQDADSIETVFADVLGADDSVVGVQDLALGAARIAATTMVGFLGRERAEAALLNDLARNLGDAS